MRKRTELLVVHAGSNKQKLCDIENLVVAQAHNLELLHIKTDAVLKHLGVTPDALHPNPLSTISSLPTPSLQPNGSHQSPTNSRTAHDRQITNEPLYPFPSPGFDENSDSIAAHAGAVLQHTSALLVHSARAIEARSRELPASGAHVHALVVRDEDASTSAITASADPEPLLLTMNQDSSAQASERTNSSGQELYRGRSDTVRGGPLGMIAAGSSSPMRGRSALVRDVIRGDVSDED